jgi:hypothetical protein
LRLYIRRKNDKKTVQTVIHITTYYLLPFTSDHMKTYIYTIAFFGLSLQSVQALNPTQAYQSETLGAGKLNSDNWKKSVQAIDYTPRPKAPPKPIENTNVNPPNWRPRGDAPDVPSFSFSDDFGKILLIGGIILIVALVIFQFLMRGNSNKTIRRPSEYTIEEIEQNLHEAEIDRFLREAVAKQDYRLAVRLYFLAIMKELSLKKIIEWQRDKTNGAYLREVRYNARDWAQDFAQVTLIFEYVWYSDAPFDAKGYSEVETYYKNLLAKVS